MSDNLGIIVPSIINTFGGKTTKAFRSIGPIIANITENERHHDEMRFTDHPIEQGALVTDHAYKLPAEVTIRCAWSDSAQKPVIGLTNSSTDQILQSFVLGQGANIGINQANKAINGSGLPVNISTALEQVGQIQALSSFTAAINSGTGKGTSAMADIYDQLLALQVSAVPLTVYTGKRRYVNMGIKSITVETDFKTEHSLAATLVLRELLFAQTQTVTVGASQENQANPEETNPTTNNGDVTISAVTDNRARVALSVVQLKGL